MPKTFTPAMRAHLDAETTRLAAIWRITRKDGAQFFFTDHERDIVFGGCFLMSNPSASNWGAEGGVKPEEPHTAVLSVRSQGELPPAAPAVDLAVAKPRTIGPGGIAMEGGAAAATEA
jgi:hypothetical protein